MAGFHGSDPCQRFGKGKSNGGAESITADPVAVKPACPHAIFPVAGEDDLGHIVALDRIA
jgi:hypothetical protein